MRTRIIAVIAALCLALMLFSACGAPEEENKEPTDYVPKYSDTEDNNEDGNTGPVADEPATEGVKLNADELSSLYSMLFGNRYGDNWYLRSVPVLWNSDSPANINLYTLFCSGFSGECDNYTDEEIMFLASQLGLSISDIRSAGQYRLPELMIDAVLREYYGIALMESNGVGLESLTYWSDTNSYYFLGYAAESVHVGIHSAYEQEDGGFIIYYSRNENNPAPDYVMTLVPNNYGSYTITMNRSVD